jgi:cytochrome c-type biogenesis protein CcmH
MGLAVVLAAAIALGATLLYAKLGRPDLAQPGGGGGDLGTQQVADLLPRLEAKVRAHPDDPAGLRLLGGAYMAVGRYADAAADYEHLAKVAPGDADALSARGDALTRAASGVVTPPAASAFRAALARDPADPRARYFLALAKDQGGDHAGAMDDWIALIKSAPPGAPWAAQVRDFVEQSAREHHEDISARLPPASYPASTGEGGPAKQQAMIAGMVERLDTRLKANPKDLDGWVNLMRARLVLGQGEAAKSAYDRGRAAFADAPADEARLTQAAKALGVPGA